MSVRFDAAADYLLRSADLPAVDPLSVSLDVYVAVDRNAASPIFSIFNATATQFIQLSTDTDGTTLRMNTQTLGTNVGALTVGQWHNVQYRRSGATHEVRIDGGSWVTHTDNNSVTVSSMLVGSNTINFLNGRVANLKIWTAQLSSEELHQERQTIRPHRSSNLYGFWPMFPGSGERARDYSGNGRAFTENGTLTDEDHPPVSWGGVSQWSTYVAAAGGTQSVTPDAIASTTTLHAPTVTPGVVTVTPDNIASTTTLHAPTITTGAVSVTPDHIASTTSLHAPTVSPGAVSVTPDHIASTTTLYAPVVNAGGSTVVPDAIASTTTLHAPTINPGAVTVTPGHIASTATLHSPSVVPGSVTVTPDAISSTVALYAPTLNLGISVGHIASTAVLHGPTVLPGSVTVIPGHIASTVTLYAPTVTGGQTVTFDYPLSVSLNSPRRAALNGPRRVVLNQGRKVDLG